jgi:hypothetical protein
LWPRRGDRKHLVIGNENDFGHVIRHHNSFIQFYCVTDFCGIDPLHSDDFSNPVQPHEGFLVFTEQAMMIPGEMVMKYAPASE